MRKLSESEKEELQKKIDDYHEQNLLDIAREADRHGQRREPFVLERKGIKKGVLGGIVMMAIAVVWSVIAGMFGWFFFYTPILFIIGLYAFIKGLIAGNLSGEEEESSRRRGVKILAIVIVVAISLFLGIWILNAIKSPGSGEWREFNSSEGKFSVLMPGNPAKKIETIETLAGTLDAPVFSLVQEDSMYAVAYCEYPDILIQANTPDAILDSTIDSIKGFGKPISELLISLDGYPGRELKLEMESEESDLPATLRIRIFMVNNKLCRIMVVTPRERDTSKDVIKFLDSFKVSEE